MQATGRTAVLNEEQRTEEESKRQHSKNHKRETRHSLMRVVGHATDVLVKRAPFSNIGELPHMRWDYHERIITGRRLEEQ